MNQWRWKLDFSVENDIKRLDPAIRRRIIDKLDWLATNCGIVKHEPLTGEYRDYFRLRVGKIRLLYKLNWEDKVVIFVYIDSRDKVYK